MQEIEVTRLVGNGEYEAILRKTEVTLTGFECWFEILDGSAEAADPGGWLNYADCWKVGQRYRVQVVQTYQVGGGEVIHYSLVQKVLGEAERQGASAGADPGPGSTHDRQFDAL